MHHSFLIHSSTDGHLGCSKKWELRARVFITLSFVLCPLCGCGISPSFPRWAGKLESESTLKFIRSLFLFFSLNICSQFKRESEWMNFKVDSLSSFPAQRGKDGEMPQPHKGQRTKDSVMKTRALSSHFCKQPICPSTQHVLCCCCCCC